MYRTLERAEFSDHLPDKQMEIQVTSFSNLSCKFEIVTRNADSLVVLFAT